MTEPPQDDQRPGAPQPYGRPQPERQQPPDQQPYGRPEYGQPQYGQPQYGQPSYGQPQYGQPSYGQGQYGQPQYAAPARKSHVGLIAGVTVGLLLVIALVVVLALTLGSTVLDRAAVERDVAAQFEEREGVAIDLDCPGDMEVEKGATYECAGTTDDGEDVTLQITIDDENGARYSWDEP